MWTYIYARVSTFGQMLHGHSIEAQVQACLNYCDQHDLIRGKASNSDLPGVFIDGGKSAFKKKLYARPGGHLLLEALKPGDTVVVTATHRLFRQMSDMVTTIDHWIQKGVTVRFVDYPMLNTDTANGKAMLYIFAVIAQLKSELTSARTREAFQLKKGKPAAAPRLPVVPPVVERVLDEDGASLQAWIYAQKNQPQQVQLKTIRAYVRVSTPEQTVEQQKVNIQKFLPPDVPVVWYVDEGQSAFKTPFAKRPAGKNLLEDLQEGDMVAVWRADRIFRSLSDMASRVDAIHAAGAYLQIVEGGIQTNTPFGKTIVSLLSLLAEVESQEIGRSSKQAILVGLAKGHGDKMLPKFLRKPGRHHRQKHYAFHEVFSASDMFNMYMQFIMTWKHFNSESQACRTISNKWMARKGLPRINGEEGELVKAYLSRLQAMQKKEFHIRRDRLIEIMKKLPPNSEIRYPINPATIAWVKRRQKMFLDAAKKWPGRLRNKQVLTQMTRICDDPDSAVDTLRRLACVQPDNSN